MLQDKHTNAKGCPTHVYKSFPIFGLYRKTHSTIPEVNTHTTMKYLQYAAMVLFASTVSGSSGRHFSVHPKDMRRVIR
jgi:hypothetical protein